MSFESILFPNVADRVPDTQLSAPDFFVDLNLDQIVATVTAGKEEYNLAPFFYAPLHDVDSVVFRHEVMRDLENAGPFDAIKAFAKGMQEVRENLAQLKKRYYEHQKECWLLDAVTLYGDSVNRLVRDLATADLKSRGLTTFKVYLIEYAASTRFTALINQARRLKAALDAIRYGIFIQGLRVEVYHYAGQPDYSAQVEAAFERFQQGGVHRYAIKFSDSAEMNHVEGQILDGVAHLHPDVFTELESFRTTNDDFLDMVITTFDREIQFYVSYLDYLARLKQGGLHFCYPIVSGFRKDVHNRQGFDLALAAKLVAKGRVPVCNDFFLEGPERIIVVSGPNQGGKTTFARTFGQLHYLASLGCLVPGAEAQLYLPDRIFTHFERQEHMTTLRGKLEDDVFRIHAILNTATPRSMIIINEIFASTTLRDAIFLSKKIATVMMQLDILGVWVTFLDEVSSLGEKTVSMISTVVPENPVQRTFKILRRPANGLAYAMSLAEKYKLTYNMIVSRVGP